jgi:glycosyltransferase involved in cell wall biosynthesis
MADAASAATAVIRGLEHSLQQARASPATWTRAQEAQLRSQLLGAMLGAPGGCILDAAVEQLMAALAAAPSPVLLAVWQDLLESLGNSSGAAGVRALGDALFGGGTSTAMLVAIYTGVSGRFTGGGMGGPGVWGSELAAVQLAQAFAAQHGSSVRVVVFCECLAFDAPPVPYAGVTYLPRQWYATWQAAAAPRRVRLLIVSRFLHFFMDNSVFEPGVGPEAVVLWLHDRVPHYLTASGREALPEQGRPLFRLLLRVPELRLVCVSRWQADEVARLAAGMSGADFRAALGPERLCVIGNGLDATLLSQQQQPQQPQRHPYRLIFCSDPDRGLPLLLELFADIRAAQPEAQLHVYWTPPAPGSELAMALERAGPGVRHFGKVSQAELARALAGARVMLYPNHGHETFCMAALEAIAAGCHVIARQYSGIAETVEACGPGAGTLILGDDVRAPDWRAAAVAAALRLFSVSAACAAADDASTQARAYTWGAKAESWGEWLGLG